MSRLSRQVGGGWRTGLLLVAALALPGCGAGEGAAGIPAAWPGPGTGVPNGDDPVTHSLNLLSPHDGVILSAMRLHAVYVGEGGVDGVANRDGFLSWVLGSRGYWNVLGQYGVAAGALVQSERISTASFFTSEVLASGSVTESRLGELIFAFASNFSTGDAYIFFMPTSIGITVADDGPRGSCSVFGGYHWFIGVDQGPVLPYAVIPTCPGFPADMPVSHELAEMATDPTGDGWYDDGDGEEVGDLCNFPVSQPIDLWSPTRLWSNADGVCAPP